MCEPDEISLFACSRSSNVGQIANQAVMPLAGEALSLKKHGCLITLQSHSKI